MQKKLQFDKSHGNHNEAHTPQDLCTNLLSAKIGGGINFRQEQKTNDSNETSAFNNKSEMHNYRKMIMKKKSNNAFYR